MESLRQSWHGSIFAANPLKRFTTKHRNHMFCVKRKAGDYDVNSITLSVKDENGNLFDFKDHPLEFEVEIN